MTSQYGDTTNTRYGQRRFSKAMYWLLWRHLFNCNPMTVLSHCTGLRDHVRLILGRMGYKQVYCPMWAVFSRPAISRTGRLGTTRDGLLDWLRAMCVIVNCDVTIASTWFNKRDDVICCCHMLLWSFIFLIFNYTQHKMTCMGPRAITSIISLFRTWMT